MSQKKGNKRGTICREVCQPRSYHNRDVPVLETGSSRLLPVGRGREKEAAGSKHGKEL